MVCIARRKTGASTSNLIGNVMILNDPMTHNAKMEKETIYCAKMFILRVHVKLYIKNNTTENSFTNFNCKFNEKMKEFIIAY